MDDLTELQAERLKDISCPSLLAGLLERRVPVDAQDETHLGQEHADDRAQFTKASLGLSFGTAGHGHRIPYPQRVRLGLAPPPLPDHGDPAP